MSARTLTVVSIALAVALVGAVLVPAPDAAASVSAQLICEPAGNGAFCEARPFGSEYTYFWTTSGSLYFPQGCGDSPFCTVACWTNQSGTVTVTVTAPDGSSDSATKWIGCGGGPYSY
ncbi:MAG: hypothetical protein PVG07_07095 [Acidobacteriota bacterium]